MVNLGAQVQERLGKGQFNDHFNISLSHQYAFMQISKSACTALKMSLGEAELRSGNFYDEAYPYTMQNAVVGSSVLPSPHRPVSCSPFVKPYQLSTSLLEDVLQSPHYFRFLVVRDPLERALSAYLDTVKRERRPFLTLQAELRALRGLPPTAAPIRGDAVTFIEFLQAIQLRRQQKGWGMVDQHYRSQSFHSCSDLIPYTEVFPLPRYNDCMATLEQRIGIPIRSFGAGGHSTSAAARVDEVRQNPSVRALVSAL